MQSLERKMIVAHSQWLYLWSFLYHERRKALLFPLQTEEGAAL